MPAWACLFAFRRAYARMKFHVLLPIPEECFSTTHDISQSVCQRLFSLFLETASPLTSPVGNGMTDEEALLWRGWQNRSVQ